MNTYADFLAAKRIQSSPVGFEIDRDATNPAEICRTFRGISAIMSGTASVLETPNAAPDQPSCHYQEVAMSHSIPRVPRVELTCPECGRSFRRYPSEIKKNARSYCSKACVGSAKRNGSIVYCDLCDSAFYRRFGEQDLGVRVRQFCSRECYMEWRAINRSPETYPKIGAVHLHRITAEEHLGRPLMRGEVVHHIDLDKHNADPTNLAVFPDQATHARCHFGEMDAVELNRYRLVRIDHER